MIAEEGKEKSTLDARVKKGNKKFSNEVKLRIKRVQKLRIYKMVVRPTVLTKENKMVSLVERQTMEGNGKKHSKHVKRMWEDAQIGTL